MHENSSLLFGVSMQRRERLTSNAGALSAFFGITVMRQSAVVTAVACRKEINDVTIETDLYMMNPT